MDLDTELYMLRTSASASIPFRTLSNNANNPVRANETVELM